MKPHDRNKKIAAFTIDVFKCDQKQVKRLADDNEETYVDILIGYNTPGRAANAYATVSLSNFTVFRNGAPLPFGLELLGVCAAHNSFYINVLATAAFCLIRSKWTAEPGATLPDVIHMYDNTCSVRHLLLCSPFLWKGHFKSCEISGRRVAWLMVVPITEEEMLYAEENGGESLEYILVKQEIDVADLNRTSVI